MVGESFFRNCKSVSACGPLLFLLTVGCQESSAPKSNASSSAATEKEANAKTAAPVSSQLSDYFDKNRTTVTGKSLFGDDAKSEPATDVSQDQQIATDSSTSAAAIDSVAVDSVAPDNSTVAEKNNIESQNEVAASDVDANRLIARIAELTEIQRTAETTDVMRDTLIEQADLAKQIFESPTSFQFRITAVKTRIHALTILDKLKVPSAYSDLVSFCDKLLQRDEPELRKMGFFGLVSAKLRTFLIDSSKQDFDDIVNTVDEYTKKSFDDYELGNELTIAASQLFKNRKRDEAVQLMSVMSENFRRSSNPQMTDLADILVAQMAMANVNLDKVIAKQVANEDENLPKLAEAMDQMISTGATFGLYNELTAWMQLFEREGKYKSIDLMAEKLQTAFRKSAESDADKYVKLLDSLDLVRSRMALVGKPFSFDGIKLANGQAFDPKTVEGKIVLITFWTSKAVQEERLQLQFETKSFEDWRPMGVEMVGFNMDDDPKAALTFFGNHPPRWTNTISDDESELGFESDFAKRCVADQTPYRILLDHTGKVAAVAVPVERLAYRITELLRELPNNNEKSTASGSSQEDNGTTDNSK